MKKVKIKVEVGFFLLEDQYFGDRLNMRIKFYEVKNGFKGLLNEVFKNKITRTLIKEESNGRKTFLRDSIDLLSKLSVEKIKQNAIDEIKTYYNIIEIEGQKIDLESKMKQLLKDTSDKIVFDFEI